jgi:hypothetical protein
MRSKNLILLPLLVFCVALPIFPDDFEEDFSDAEIGEPGKAEWVKYDEDSLGDPGPSTWSILNSPLDGPAMSQSSNIWGDATDTVAIGSCIVYDRAQWSDFIMEVDVVANDNDGMGIVWRWKDILNHYRYITMIDPGNSPNGKRGPYCMMERRLGDDEGNKLPYYKTLAEDDQSYTQGAPQNWRLEAVGDSFKFYIDGKLALEANDATYKSGKIGFHVYAQSGVFFDNLKITDLKASVNAQYKLATTWADIKR